MRKRKSILLLPSKETGSKRSPNDAFVRGFVDGLGNAPVVAEPTKVTRSKYKGRGLEGDWVVVGDSIRRAMSDR